MVFVNISKTEYIKFSKGSKNFTFHYNINFSSIIDLNEIKHLGIYYDSKLSFGHHIEVILKKGYRTLAGAISPFYKRKGELF